MKKLTTLLAVLLAATLGYAGEGKDKDRDTTNEITSDIKGAAKDVKDEVTERTGETTAEAEAESKEAKRKAKDEAKEAKAEAKEAKADLKAKNMHEVEAEIVSVDSAKGTVTLKTTKGESTAPVEGKAQTALKDFKPGQKVTVTCRDDDKGTHKAVTDIKTSTTTSDKK